MTDDIISNTIHPLDIALALAIEGKFELSEDILRAQDPFDPRVKFNLGWHALRTGNLLEGFEGLDAGRWINVFGSPPLNEQTSIWRGPKPTILLRSEGGLGDHIINARFATPLSKYGTVVLTTAKSLVPILSQIDGVSACYPDDSRDVPFHDYWVPAMSAPRILQLEYATLSGAPYLKVPPRALDGKFKVGLRWSGNPQFEHEQHRRFNSQMMIDLAKIDGATFYSLQRDTDLIDVPFTDLRHEMKTWEDTAAILAGLDLVITSDTSITHCAAALGIEVWNIIPIMPYYLYAVPGNTTPWHDTMTLYRQEVYGEWSQPFEKITQDLQEKIRRR